jgi:Alpha/beta hydrolase domain containing 18
MALESPFYGKRRPAYQSGSKLHRVSDLLALGRATIEESLSLLNWAQVNGFNNLGNLSHNP